jgi:hypothetical protein
VVLHILSLWFLVPFGYLLYGTRFFAPFIGHVIGTDVVPPFPTISVSFVSPLVSVLGRRERVVDIATNPITSQYLVPPDAVGLVVNGALVSSYDTV